MNAVELTKLAAVLGRKWTPTLLVTLVDGPMRHGPLTRKLRGISRKVLHESLDSLMIDGLIEKAIFIDDCGKPATTYGLTTLGESLVPLLELMQEWCSDHLAELLLERCADEVVILLDRPSPH